MGDVESAFRRLVSDYLEACQRTYAVATSTDQATPELSYRPALHDFLKSLPNVLGLEHVEIIFEPRKQAGAGRPDWRFHDSLSMAIFGYVEANEFDPDRRLNPTALSTKIEKYSRLHHRMVFTDGIDFIFYRPDRPQTLTRTLVDKPLPRSGQWSALRVNLDLLSEFRDFFAMPSIRRLSNRELMKEMAFRARLLAEDVAEVVKLDPGSGFDAAENKTIEALHGLKELMQKAHDPDLCDDRRFSDMISHLLVFGMMFAYWNLAPILRQPKDLSEGLHRFWTVPIRQDGANRLRPFRALADCMTSLLWLLGPLATWYSDSILSLSHVEVSPDSQTTPNFHELYEEFLESYDPVTRIDFGAYATPMPLALYMATFCDWISRAKFIHPTLYAPGNKLIDPCCGTGTFLEAILTVMSHSTDTQRGFPAIAGFEILPAPYTLAQYRLTLLHSQGVHAAQSVRVVLCNTLSDHVVDSTEPVETRAGPQIARTLLHEERTEAATIATPPITAVVGNPPSSDAGLHIDESTHSKILHLVDEFRPPHSQRTARQNIQKQLQNDFIKFLRWACHKLPTDAPGIVAFVLPASFLKHLSYAHARSWLLGQFNWLWVVEFDKDARTGTRTSNLFATLQGRAVLFCARRSVTAQSSEAKYLSILEMDREGKRRFFSIEADLARADSNRAMDSNFAEIDPTHNGHRFQSRAPVDQMYESFWNLCPAGGNSTTAGRVVFDRHCGGVKLGITSALVHVDELILLRRARDIGNLRMSYETLKAKWFRGQRRPPSESTLTPSIREEIGRSCQGRGHPNEHVKLYAFRPFCTMNVLLPTSLLQRLAGAGGGGARYRPEILAAYSTPDNFGIAVAPAPEDIGDTLHRFSSFAWHIPDNDLCTRGNAHVFCLRFPDYRRRQTWDETPRLNVSSDLLRALDNRSESAAALAAKVIFYVYAVLCSNAYLDRFETALYRTAGEWPRIPFPNSYDLFSAVADLGRQLADCERPGIAVPPDVEALNALPQGEIPVNRFVIDEAASIVTIEATDGRRYHVPISDRSILSCKIAGYRVLAEWLKWRSWPYLRRTFRQDDAIVFAQLITAVREQFRLIDKIDDAVRQILSDPSRLI